jgi:hypothetical protein
VARPQKPIPKNAGPALRALTVWLRQQYKASGLSFKDLAKKANYGASSTLSRACAGTHVPPPGAVKALVEACGKVGVRTADPERAGKLLRAARREAALPGTGLRRRSPETVSTPEALGEAMRRIRADLGQPPLRVLVERARPRTLCRSTLDRLLNEGALPREQDLEAYLTACGLPHGGIAAWVDTLRRITAVHASPGRRTAALTAAQPAPLTLCEEAERAHDRREREEEIMVRLGRVPDLDDEEIYGHDYLYPEPPQAEYLDDNTLEQWAAEAEAARPGHAQDSLADRLRAIAARTDTS